MIFYFFGPTKYLRAKRTVRAKKIKKRSKAEEIFHLPAKRPQGAKQQDIAKRALRASG